MKNLDGFGLNLIQTNINIVDPHTVSKILKTLRSISVECA